MRGFSAGGGDQKNHHLRPTRLRRSSASHHASSSGEHSLPGVDFAGAPLSSYERSPHRSWQFPPVKVLSPEENIPKDYHLRPPRLRRSSAACHASSSGQHSLPGVELAGATRFSDKRPPLIGVHLPTTYFQNNLVAREY